MRRRYKNVLRKKDIIKHRIVFSSIIFCLTFMLAIGYSAFSANINLSVKGNVKEKPISISDITKNTVTYGDGLYKDPYEESKYIYKGKDPNNYLNFSNELWRIISISSDNTIKIIKENNIGSFYYNDTSDNNDWNSSSLNAYLNNEYINSLNEKEKIIKGTFYNGYIENLSKDKSLAEVIELEKSSSWDGNIALLSLSEYISASTNEDCKTYFDARPNKHVCYINNYLHDTSFWGGIWLLNGFTSPNNGVYIIWNIEEEPNNINYAVSYAQANSNIIVYVKPVLFVKTNNKLYGLGNKEKPYHL